MPHTFTILATVFTLTVALLHPVDAATYWVSKSGSNGNSCSTAQQGDSSAKQSIRDGAACLSSGDTLLIQSGTYDERLTYSQGFPWRSGTKLARASANDVVTIKPSGGGDHVVSTYQQHDIELDGLTIDATNAIYGIKFEDSHRMTVRNSDIGYSWDIPSGNCVGAYGQGNQLIKNRIHHCTEYGVYWGGTDGLIEGNTIHENGGYGIHHYSSDGGVNRHIIRGNTIWGNGFSSHMINGTPFQTPAVIIASGSESQFVNNVVYNNQDGLQMWSSNTLVAYNTFYGNGGIGCINNDGTWGGARDTVIRNNICYRNARNEVVNTGSATVSNHLTQDPRFIDAAGGNFHLQSGSPAIDQGVTLSLVTTDMDGGARPVGGAPDIGADEYGSSGGGQAPLPPVGKLPAPRNLRIVK